MEDGKSRSSIFHPQSSTECRESSEARSMNSEDFLEEILTPVHEFCRTLDANPPAYCYVPLRTDEESPL
jgi:hypothetical protein